MNPGAYRILRRLAIATVLLVIIAVVHGLDVAMIVTFSLAVMEIEAYGP
jgi:hypothetical protein